jgi:hypothetical protein
MAEHLPYYSEYYDSGYYYNRHFDRYRPHPHNLRTIELVTGTYYMYRRGFHIPYDVIDAGETLTKAYLTVKIDLADSDAEAVFQKEITTTEVAGQGWLEYYALGSYMYVRFYLTPSDTALLEPEIPHAFDVKYLTSGGKMYVPELGIIMPYRGVTLANS